MGGWVDGHFDIFFDILLKPPQPFTGLFFQSGICVVYKNRMLATIHPFGCGISSTGQVQPYPY